MTQNLGKLEANKTKIYERHYEDSSLIPAGEAEIFAFIEQEINNLCKPI